MMKKLSFWITILILVSCSTAQMSVDPSVKGTTGQKAMVVSADPLASEVGSSIMNKGGNAWDAAIGVQFALAVVFPVAGNIGGGGFAVFRESSGEVGSLDFREKAPKRADRDMYLDDQGNIDGRKSLEGHLAAGVPGSVDGMVQLYDKYGSLPWSDLVQPAVELAREGFILTEEGAANLNRGTKLIREVNKYEVHLLKEVEWKAGDKLVQEDLARTLERIRDDGRDGFYSGETAKLIVDEMQSGGGIISYDDLESYQSVWREPLIGNYRGKRIISMPPPSSGGVALIQLLEGVEAFPISRFGHNSWKSVHVMTEVEKRVYADRATYLGDPDFYEVPVDMLLNEDYIRNRMADIKLNRVTPASDIKKGNVEIVESVQTTHFSVVDPDGNAVSITTTLNSYFGCKVLVKGAGFFLNNEMDDFSVKAGVPNQFGLVGAEANEIVPEKRMLSSMTPTIVDDQDGLFMVVGTPGGSTIITSVFQTILNVIDHGMNMQQAVNARRVHNQWLPDRILSEDHALNESVKKKLIRLGHTFEERGNIGRVDAILVLPNGDLEGGADPRGDDAAIGF
ncbi:MAG: gamma-glutamyltransferase [Saprospiraceae bacterium]|nr:gamma-glutamyltransferase [Saprospiraceae bacterium]